MLHGNPDGKRLKTGYIKPMLKETNNFRNEINSMTEIVRGKLRFDSITKC